MIETMAVAPRKYGNTLLYYITTPEGVDYLIRDLASAKTLEIDTETMKPPSGSAREAGYLNIYNLQEETDDLGEKVVNYAPFDPHSALVRLVQLRSRDGLPYVVDLLKIGEDAKQILANFLRKPGRVYLGHNIRFDLKQIAGTLSIWLPEVRCTMQMSVMIGHATGNRERGNRLSDLSRDFLGIELSKVEQKSDWSVPGLTDEQIEYAALDVMHLHSLFDILEDTLVNHLGMQEPYELEMAVLPATARMEFWGIPVDVKMVEKVQSAAHQSLPTLLRRVALCFKEIFPPARVFKNGKWTYEPSINLGSKKFQVLPMLQEYGLDVENCQRATLEAYRETHEGVRALIDYWSIEKQAQFDYLKYVHPITGRIHSQFLPSGASTYRYSSKNPNCQQIPAKVYLSYTCPMTGKVEMVNYRYCFHAIKYWLICSADFGGQEVAVMAAISDDTVMMGILNEGGDLHAEAAASMFGIDPSETRQKIPDDPSGKSYRDRGKQLNFGIPYGMSEEGFAALWKVSKEKAKEFIKGYEKRFSNLAKYLRDAGKASENSNFSRLLNGAIRFVGGGGDANRTDKGGANRAGKNFRIQGLSSFMTRIAIITLDEFIMKGFAENKWAMEAAGLVRDAAIAKRDQAFKAMDQKGLAKAIADLEVAERLLAKTPIASKEALINASPLRGVLPLEIIAMIHDELLTHFKTAHTCPMTKLRNFEIPEYEAAKAALKAAEKAKDKEAEKAAKAQKKAIEEDCQARCDATCPKTYTAGQECVSFFERIIGLSMTLAGTYYLRNKVPASFDTATGPYWIH